MKQYEIIELREKVLKRIRNSLINKVEISSEQQNIEVKAFPTSTESVEFEFASNFTAASGFFYFSDNRQELKLALNALLKEKNFINVYCSNEEIADLIGTGTAAVYDNLDDLTTVPIVLSECEYLCARTGSIMMSSFLSCGRRGIASNDALIVVATIDQILPDIEDAIQAISDKYSEEFPSQITFVTGPSRTADIENQLVIGAHGSTEVYVFLY